MLATTEYKGYANITRTEEDPGAPFMLNVIQDWGKMPQPKPKAVSKENQPPKRAKKEAKGNVQVMESTGKDGLGDKGTLKSWLDAMGKDTSI